MEEEECTEVQLQPCQADANVTWYKKRKREEGEEEGEEEGGDRDGRRKIQKKENGEKAQPVSNQPAKAVMFTPYTTQRILAKRMREARRNYCH